MHKMLVLWRYFNVWISYGGVCLVDLLACLDKVIHALQ